MLVLLYRLHYNVDYSQMHSIKLHIINCSISFRKISILFITYIRKVSFYPDYDVYSIMDTLYLQKIRIEKGKYLSTLDTSYL